MALTDQYRDRFAAIVKENDLLNEEITVEVKPLTTEQAIGMLEALLPGKEHPPVRRGEIYLSLGKLYQDKKDYDRAFEYFVTGNKLMPYRFDRDEHRRLIDSTIATFDRETLQQLPRAGNMSERPVFIVAMPRSGTTLMTALLDGHTDLLVFPEEYMYVRPQALPAETDKHLVEAILLIQLNLEIVFLIHLEIRK